MNELTVRQALKHKAPFRSRLLGLFMRVFGVVWMFCFPLEELDEINPDLRNNFMVSVLALSPGFLLLTLGYKVGSRTFDPVRNRDKRRPILYLRSFAADGRGTLQPRTWLAFYHGIYLPFSDTATLLKTVLFFNFWHPVKIFGLLFGRDRFTTEETLWSAFKKLGRFVAIGSPGEKLATPGADRLYVEDHVWKESVESLLRDAQVVVVRLAASSGLEWELSQVFRIVPIERILLLSSDVHGNNEFNGRVFTWLNRSFGVPFPAELPAEFEPFLVYFETDRTTRIQQIVLKSPILWSLSCSAVDVRDTFSSFIQGINGGQRKSPCRQKKRSRLESFVSLLIVPAFVILVLLLVVLSLIATSFVESLVS